MLTKAYYQIWRPARNNDSKYCTAQNFSKGFFELCAGYAEAENHLRSILTKYGQNGSSLIHQLNIPNPSLYPSMKQVIFELQENYKMILNSNGRKCGRSISSKDFALLDEPMGLSSYTCSIKLEGNNMELKPFSGLPESLSPWYLENLTVFSSSKNYVSNLTLGNLLSAEAALRCLLYAQFGPESETAISPVKSEAVKSRESGYYRIDSLFTVTPPSWPEESWYDITYKPPILHQITTYPLNPQHRHTV